MALIHSSYFHIYYEKSIAASENLEENGIKVILFIN